MQKKTILNFGKFETASVLINVFLVKIFLGLPGELARVAATGGWAVALLSSAIFLILLFFILKICENSMETDLISMAESILGRPLMLIFSFIVAISFLAKGALSLRVTSEIIVTALPFNLPLFACLVLLIFASFLSAFKGKEGIIRLHACFVPLILAAFVFVIALSISPKNLSNLYPIFGFGAKEIVKDGIKYTGIYSDIIYIFLLSPHVKNKKVMRRATIWGALVAAISIILVTLSYIAAVPYPASTKLFMPIYQVSRLIGKGANSQGYEAFLLPVWIISSLLYISLSVYFSAFFISRSLRIKKDKAVLIPAGLAIFLIALMPRTLNEASMIGAKYVSGGVFVVSAMAVLIAGAKSIRIRRKVCRKN